LVSPQEVRKTLTRDQGSQVGKRQNCRSGGIWRVIYAGRRSAAWFIFPQIVGLGRSATARRTQSTIWPRRRAYLAHPVLGPRLVECAKLVASHRGLSAEQIFGGIDAIKLRSSMTLFAHADPDQKVFGQVIDQYFEGPDPETLRRV
jgi:uncharacterized protein (DUF1810 family)